MGHMRNDCAVLFILCLTYSSEAFRFDIFDWSTPTATTGIDAVSKATRWNIPWLGIGMRCNGCPQSSCEDNEAIIHGYCCGCAASMDKLPVICPQFLQCPLNLHGLCHDYEYMMRCCC